MPISAPCLSSLFIINAKIVYAIICVIHSISFYFYAFFRNFFLLYIVSFFQRNFMVLFSLHGNVYYILLISTRIFGFFFSLIFSCFSSQLSRAASLRQRENILEVIKFYLSLRFEYITLLAWLTVSPVMENFTILGRTHLTLKIYRLLLSRSP